MVLRFTGKRAEAPISAPKTEGTSTTYGQNIEEAQPELKADFKAPSGIGSKRRFFKSARPLRLRGTTQEAEGSVASTGVGGIRGKKETEEDTGFEITHIAESDTVKESEHKSTEEINKILTEAQKVDLLISLRSDSSEIINFNTIKIPEFEGNFVYNFFMSDEEDVELQEDQSKDPLLKSAPSRVSKYVGLEWIITDTTEPMTGTESAVKDNKKLRDDAFSQEKGVFSDISDNFKNSIESNKKRTAPTSAPSSAAGRGIGPPKDLNSLEVGFDAVSNPLKYSNNISATVEPKTDSVLDFIPTN